MLQSLRLGKLNAINAGSWNHIDMNEVTNTVIRLRPLSVAVSSFVLVLNGSRRTARMSATYKAFLKLQQAH